MASHAKNDVLAGQQLSAVILAVHCKTVGSAYPGSNPGPATHKPRSEPVTRKCVTGSDAESKRCRRPLVGHAWARSRRLRVLADLDPVHIRVLKIMSRRPKHERSQ